MSVYFRAEKIELIRSGEQYFELLIKLIRDSRQIIHLQTYIFDDDRTGQVVLQELCLAAKRGVQIYLLLDAFGSPNFKKSLQRVTASAGIHFRFFAPLFSTENIFAGRRLHHKILCVDGYKAVIGGINIADKYHGGATAVPWLDFALYSEARDNFFLQQLCEDFYFKRLQSRPQIIQVPTSEPVGSLSYRRNDWIRGHNEIHKSYREKLSTAEEEITIIASYFLPGRKFRKLLKAAVQRKVKVRLIIAGKSDTQTVRYAENYLYDYYLRNKIEIYEWRNSVMHGKAMLVDKSWCTIGSYNLNFLSHFASIELNGETMDPSLIHDFKKEVNEIIGTTSFHVNAYNYKVNTNLLIRLTRWLSYNTFRIFRTIFAGFTKRRKKHLH